MLFSIALKGQNQKIYGITEINIKYLSIKALYIEEAAVLAERYDIDFDDVINAVVMHEEGIKEIYALDRDCQSPPIEMGDLLAQIIMKK
ncbi:hypothetical protein BMS3Bbin15_00535 [archaeon BMS3Bbin15]|nr:hypothetical protein BMS3Bbin15_00535 [archaeon BMS3Bbin15]